MSDLLLEIFSEEIPARMQADASSALTIMLIKECVSQKLLPEGILSERISSFVTPRRMAIAIKNLPVTQPDISSELKGPKIDAPEAALNGFLKKQPKLAYMKSRLLFVTVLREK